MTHETDHDAAIPNPDGCRWCGADKYAHHQRWTPEAGLHVWTEPTTEQRKHRMIERRRAAGGFFRSTLLSLRAAVVS